MRAAEGGIRGFVSGRVSVRNAGETAGCDGYVQEGARGIGKANPISRELGLADYCLLTPRWAYVPIAGFDVVMRWLDNGWVRSWGCGGRRF